MASVSGWECDPVCFGKVTLDYKKGPVEVDHLLGHLRGLGMRPEW